MHEKIIGLPSMLRIAADHFDDGTYPLSTVELLRAEADRLERAAAAADVIEEGARIAATEFIAAHNGGPVEVEWDQWCEENQRGFRNISRALHGHFVNKPALDSEGIAREIVKWINENGELIYRPIPASLMDRLAFISALGLFVTGLVNGSLAGNSRARDFECCDNREH